MQPRLRFKFTHAPVMFSWVPEGAEKHQADAGINPHIRPQVAKLGAWKFNPGFIPLDVNYMAMRESDY